MITKIPFIKMHGLGNDFVIIEDYELSKIQNIKNFVINISNRRIGVGCDQFITYDKQNKFVIMNIFNQDGSKAKACGNASRCVSRIMHDNHHLDDISLKIDDKSINVQYSDPNNITVNMGKPNFTAPWMPQPEHLWLLAEKYMIEPKEVLCVDVGNPHLVIFKKLSSYDKEIIGTDAQKHPLFPGGINVNFASISDNEITLKVWERGAGFTYACGSGASATFAAANKLGFVDNNAKVIFELGHLKMNQKDGNVLMTGPASYVFSGEYLHE